ncbi:hypothetical protein [Nocardioides sp.]|uniref:hypothetical protein n=1 Tax=Nocardioides sp. TaxID=35761 RepID=UPI00262A1191|nr:hypothetical protein [Nocardioides sp.]
MSEDRSGELILKMSDNVIRVTEMATTSVDDIKRLGELVIKLAERVADLERRLDEGPRVEAGPDPKSV